MDEPLTTLEHSQLQALVKAGHDALKRRAQIILLKAEGLSTREISQTSGLSPSRVRYWVREFARRRLAIFPANALEAVKQPDLIDIPMGKDDGDADPVLRTDHPQQVEQARASNLTQSTIERLCENFAVDMGHAEFVAKFAVALFDETRQIHNLPGELRSLCHTAALLHNVGLVAHPQKHHSFGRDILLEHQLSGLSDLEMRTLAFTTATHRKKYRQKRIRKEARLCELREDQLDMALALSALVRLADGLDYSQSQTTKIRPISDDSDALVFSVEGPFANIDGLRAQAKGDLWEAIYDQPIRFVVEGERQIMVERPAETTFFPIPDKRLKSPGILRDDWMSEAGRKILRLHFYRMVDHETGTRRGEDIEELHDMRVAIRRMRSAIGIFEPYFRRKTLKPYVRGLQRTGRVLGGVRDLDVFMHKAQAYIQNTSPTPDLSPLLLAWDLQLAEAREKMIAELDHRRYREFVRTFADFLNTEGAGAKRPGSGKPSPLKVFQSVPTLIYQRDQHVRAYDGLFQEPQLEMLHALRIDIKRFRYTLEYFREVLGPESKEVIRSAVKLQDHLGDLNDADVACQILIEFLDQWRLESQREQVDLRGITDYLVTKQLELRNLVNTFPEQWEAFNNEENRRNLALAVAHL